MQSAKHMLLSVTATIAMPSMPGGSRSAAAGSAWFSFPALHHAPLLFLTLQNLIVQLVSVLKH